MKPFYITTPIYYANSLPHLGHLYTTIVADAIHRYKKQRGFDVYFLTGTDEHGINIQRAAERENRTPQEQVDVISTELKRMFRDFKLDPENGGYDIFMRTTEPYHYAGVQHLWQEIAGSTTPKGRDAIYEGSYQGWFCAPCAEYKADSEFLLHRLDEEFGNLSNALIREFENGYKQGVVTKVAQVYFSDLLQKLASGGINLPYGFFKSEPSVSGEEELLANEISRLEELSGKRPLWPAFEILENYVEKVPESILDQSLPLVRAFEELRDLVERNDLLDPSCLIHNARLDLVAEDSYYFRLSDYDDFLVEIIENTPDLVRPQARRNEVLSFIRGGLQDLSISREKKSVSWGVPVPDDENHVMYVWLDALSNYITALGYGNDHAGAAGMENYWPAMHLVGKDILRFHTVYWFSFLKAAGLPLPTGVYAHGMWLDADGRKMGKTLGNVIDVDVLHQHFQVDAVRYFVLREMVFGQDGKFGYENLIDRANSDLASGLGNLASRTFSMITKYREGKIPKNESVNRETVEAVNSARDEFIKRFDNFEFSQALEAVWTIIARVDKIISDAKPWDLAKDEARAAELDAVLYTSTETLRWLSVILYPVMPNAAKNIYSQIGLSDEISKLDPANLKWGELAPGTAIGETVGVFPRIDKKKVMSEISEQSAVSSEQSESPLSKGGDSSVPPAVAGGLTQPATTNSEQPTKTEESFISIDDFLKVELRVGEVIIAERIPKADKLLRFEIDLGEEKPRQILAGLAEYYDPEKLIGRKVVVVANLKPRMMRGLESQGMICAASLTEEDTPAIATFLEDVKIGARLK